MFPERSIIDTSVEQGGVITFKQVRLLGATPAQVRGRIARGAWTRVARGLYRVVNLTDPIHRLQAAVTALPGAVASHESAGRLHGFPFLDPNRVATTVDASATHRFPSVVVHRTRDLTKDHIQRKGNLPVTTKERTIVDLAAVLRPGHLTLIIDELMAAGKLDPGDVLEVLNQVARRGKPGIKKLRVILEERISDGPDTQSVLAREGLRALKPTGLPSPEIEYPIPWDEHRRFDAAFPQARLAIEWDSRRWHGRSADFERDRRRDREAVEHQWVVIRFTWDDVKYRPFDVARTVQSVYRSRAFSPES